MSNQGMTRPTSLEDLVAQYGEAIPGYEVARFLRMSPQRLADMLNRGDGPICSEEESLRLWRESKGQQGHSVSVSQLSPECGFFFVTFHPLDVQDWLEERDKKREQPGEAVASSSLAELEEVRKQLAQAQAEIEALRTELAQVKARAWVQRQTAPDKLQAWPPVMSQKQAALDNLESVAPAPAPAPAPAQGGDSSLAGLQAELDKANNQLKEALHGHGLLSEVLRRKIAGESWEEEIKPWLYKQGLSDANVGLFLREKPLAHDSYRKAGRNGKPNS